MIDRIIDDINKALDSGAYLAALSLALVLPDMCAKACYPEENRNNVRYRKWYDEYIGAYEHPPWNERITEDNHNPYLSGEVVYNLRCNVLHQATPNIIKDEIKIDENNKIDKFILLVQKKNQYDIYSDTSIVHYSNLPDSEIREYRVNVRRLCMIITRTCKGYYEENRNQFDFLNYRIVDIDTEDESFVL